MQSFHLSLSLFLLQLGRLCLGSFQPGSSVAELKSSESCIDHEEQSSSIWYMCLWVSLFLALILLGMAACCLHCWLERQRPFSSPARRLAVFAVSDTDSSYEREATLRTLPQIHPHLKIPRSSESSFAVVVGSGPPPSYLEATMQEDCLTLGATREVEATPVLHL